jgi:hypothetical protein
MNRIEAMVMLGVLCAAELAGSAQAAPTLDQMQWRRRVLLVAAPDSDDPRAKTQARIFAQWGREASDRDVSPVDVLGAKVKGAGDTADALRKRYRLPPQAFQVLLIGKDGHVALRSNQPVGAGELQGRIDAMPMRRSGQR